MQNDALLFEKIVVFLRQLYEEIERQGNNWEKIFDFVSSKLLGFPEKTISSSDGAFRIAIDFVMGEKTKRVYFTHCGEMLEIVFAEDRVGKLEIPWINDLFHTFRLVYLELSELK